MVRPTTESGAFENDSNDSVAPSAGPKQVVAVSVLFVAVHVMYLDIFLRTAKGTNAWF